MTTVGIITDLDFVHRISEEVKPEAENLDLLFMQLENALGNSSTPGVGLAGVQIGLVKRVAIVRTKSTKLNLYNPEIIEKDGAVVSPEGCLSLPGVSRSVLRAAEITVKNGDGRLYALYGFDAVVVQHEISHMNGRTILDEECRVLQVGRNDLCLCGSGKKYKRCHINNQIELQQMLVSR